MELSRKGPGLLIRDIAKGDAQVTAVVETLRHVAPDVVLLTGIDWDHGNAALNLLADETSDYPHRLALEPNRGQTTGLDLDGDGRLGGPGDAQGYGYFRGQNGMALLSKHPLALAADHSNRLWSAQPEALLYDGISDEIADMLRLSTTGHWEVDVAGLRLMAFYASTPVFDGPEDRNGRRNHDEILFWQDRLETAKMPVVILGNANLDPEDGDGRRAAIQSLLSHPRLQDPRPHSNGGRLAANPAHRGDPALDTVDWADPKPGNLRVSYVLPDFGLKVLDSAVHWPAPGEPLYSLLDGGPRHRLVWVDLER